MILWISFIGTSLTATSGVDRYISFLRRLIFAPSDLKYSVDVIFDRNHGEVNRERFQRDYGHQGQLLVDAYGKGLSKKELEALGYL